jgi:hypothetical protein
MALSFIHFITSIGSRNLISIHMLADFLLNVQFFLQ